MNTTTCSSYYQDNQVPCFTVDLYEELGFPGCRFQGLVVYWIGQSGQGGLTLVSGCQRWPWSWLYSILWFLESSTLDSPSDWNSFISFLWCLDNVIILVSLSSPSTPPWNQLILLLLTHSLTQVCDPPSRTLSYILYIRKGLELQIWRGKMQWVWLRSQLGALPTPGPHDRTNPFY